MKLSKLILLLAVPSLLSGCNPDSNGYQEKTINANFVNKTLNEKINIRFYSYKKSVPYISIKEYYRLLLKAATENVERGVLKVERNGDEYKVTSSTDTPGIFNVKNHTFTTSNINLFKSTNVFYDDELAGATYDGLPFVQVDSVEVLDDPTPMTIDFKNYDIKIFGEENDVYLPITTVCDMFTNQNLLVGAYNRSDLYFYNDTLNEDYASFGRTFVDPMLSSNMSKEYASFLFNEFCLDYDYFIGRPGRSSMEIYYNISKGLKAALKERDVGKKIIEYMSTGVVSDYATGISMLGLLMGDGGHTSFNLFNMYVYDDKTGYASPIWSTSQLYNKVNANINAIISDKSLNVEEITNRDRLYSHHGEMRRDRKSKLGLSETSPKGSGTYKVVGDTAYIMIDGFMNEFYLRDEWDAYYSEKGDIPYGKNKGGAVTATYYGLKAAKENNNVKNIIIDLSSNTGGSTDEMLYMISLLTGSENNSFYEVNTGTGQRIKYNYRVDRNLDKKFDEADDEFDLVGDKNIAVLSSRNGFSCGGISPIYLHDYGIYVIGDECGGGSCSIYYQHDASGTVRVHSSPNHTYSPKWKDVDQERHNVCDTKLEIKANADGSLDYSEFFNTINLSSLIAAHYAK